MRTKSVDGSEYPAWCFAYVPDQSRSSTWKLPIFDSKHVSDAIAALTSDFRGSPVDIPAGSLPEVVSRVRAAWQHFHPEEPMTDCKLKPVW